ncbi:DgyrCDS8345 [Dimorphilus gyrociliatus]|uniref:DgyrCDS8345 n=1 Tax=Dimorphilus gyrociliatus TaxID=2664684 RepID=A0A7I8VW82_9ANNE|nr:DgyrCDS8345 [Dimorphilus gyrociliatus]
MDDKDKYLFSAVLKKDLSTVKVSLQEKNTEEVTQLAVQNISISNLPFSIRSLDVFEKMTSCSISVTTPFLTSAALGLVDIFEIFILRGVPINTLSDEGIMACHMASLFGQKKIMKMIVEKYGGNISIPDQYGWSCLHFACVDGMKEIAQLLLEAGIDPMERDKDGTTAAYRAKEAGYIEIVDLIRIYNDSDRLLSIKDHTEDGYGYIDVDEIKEDEGYLVPNDLKSQRHSIPRPQLKRSGNESPDYTPSLPLDEEVEDELDEDDTAQIASLREVTRPRQKPIIPPPAPNRKVSQNLMDTIRQELQKFHESNLKKVTDEPKPPVPIFQPPDESDEEEDHYYSIVDDDVEEEDPYSTIAEVIAAAHKKTVPDPPTVRGRLPASKLRPGLPEQIRKDFNSITIIQDMPGSAALKRACLFVSIRINSNWPKLAKALELSNEDIKIIKTNYHYDVTQQCAVALKRWQTSRSRTVDDLVIVLKKSGMTNIVVDLQQVVSEFSA